MSFSLTEEQLVEGSKDVTRRLGWGRLKPGQEIRAVRKAMGLKPGEKIEPLAVIRIVSVNAEPLTRLMEDPHYGQQESNREGFPEKSGAQFVAMFCGHMRCQPDTVVNRIEFEVVERFAPVGAVPSQQ